jgi:N4-gp56 family major capsid protein
MAETVASTGLVPQIWSDKFFESYLRANRWRPYMGTDENAMVQVRRDLTTKAGDRVTFAAVRRLVREGVTGDQILEGNEEEIDSRAMTIAVDVLRHAVVVTKWQGQRSVISLADAARSELRRWATEKMKADLTQAALSVDGIRYSAATPAQRNTWLTNNADRVLFGAAVSNHSSNVMATALANVDSTNDRLSPGIVRLAKRRAQLAEPAIRPIMTKGSDGEEETYILFAHPLAFRDLASNTETTALYREAGPRTMANQLFASGDLMIDGVIVKEMRDIPILAGVGASGIDVAPCFFMGAQALGVAYAQTTRTVVQERDYNFRYGVAVEEIRGIEKLRFGTGTASDGALSKQAGMLNLYVSGVADA